MAKLGWIWVACKTWDKRHAGTTNNLELFINLSGINNELHVILSGKQVKGGTSIYAIDPVYAMDVDVDSLTNSSIRIGILGRDLWKPAHIFIWGQKINAASELTEVLPIAIATDIATGLSTDLDEGQSSIPIGTVINGKSDMVIRRLLVIMQTASETYAGTNDPFTLAIRTNHGEMITLPILPARYRSQEKMLFVAHVPPDFTFRKEEVSSIQLQFMGDNKWLPQVFHIFGANTESGRPSELVTLVDIQNWHSAGLSWLSSDIGEGLRRVDLPLYEFSEPTPLEPITIAPISITNKVLWKVRTSLPENIDISSFRPR